MRKIIIPIVIIFCSLKPGISQDSTYVRSIIDELSSEKYFGRGYLKSGCKKAATFLSKEMGKAGLKPYGDNYSQEINFSVNSFPENITLKSGEQILNPGTDYMPDPNCGDIKGTFKVFTVDSSKIKDSATISEIKKTDMSDSFFVIPLFAFEKGSSKRLIRNQVNKNFFNAKGYIFLVDNYPVWGVGHEQRDFPVINMVKDFYPVREDSIYIEIDTEMKEVVEKNLIGYLPGKTDKTIAFTAHYDHLGGIGDSVYIPGAHDNASGVGMCLDLARHFSNNPVDYNVVIMFFAGEEAGLHGSYNYVNDPLFPLGNIDFLINLDLVGTGEDGITIVNAKDSIYKEEWELFKNINKKNSFLSGIKARKVTPNSDHYPFHRKGVKSVFIYSKGGNTFYHHVKDDSEHVSLSNYNGIFNLVKTFANKYDW